MALVIDRIATAETATHVEVSYSDGQLGIQIDHTDLRMDAIAFLSVAQMRELIAACQTCLQAKLSDQ